MSKKWLYCLQVDEKGQVLVVGQAVLVTDLGSETTISWEVFKHEFNWHFFSHAGDKGTRVFGIGPKRDDIDRVCREAFVAVAFRHVLMW
jgi:hypothetical protein